MTHDEAVEILNVLWTGLWPKRPVTEAQAATLLPELMKDAYPAEPVREFLRKWYLTEKFAPDPCELTSAFRASVAGLPVPSSRPRTGTIIGMSIKHGFGSARDEPAELAVKWYESLWRRSSRTEPTRNYLRRCLGSTLFAECGLGWEAADALATTTFEGVEVVDPAAKPTSEFRDGIAAVVRSRQETEEEFLRRNTPPSTRHKQIGQLNTKEVLNDARGNPERGT